MMNLGSDDLLHPHLFELYLPYFFEYHVFGINKVYFFKHPDECLYFDYYNKPHIVGAGRMISKVALQKVLEQRTLYNENKSRCLDADSAVVLSRFQIAEHCINPGVFPYIVDIKSETNIHSFEEIKKSCGISQFACDIVKMHFDILN